MSDLTCLQCREPFPAPSPPRRGRKPSYCSDACRKAKAVDSSRAYYQERAAERRFFGWCLDCPEGAHQDAIDGTNYCLHHTARRAATSLKHGLARYGLTETEYESLYERQEGRCAICGDSENGRRLSVDHDLACCNGDRSCGSCVRGLLCTPCNAAIGLLRDRPDLMAAAAEYVTRDRSSVEAMT